MGCGLASQQQDERRATSAGRRRRGDGQAGACREPEIPAAKIKIPCNLKNNEIPSPISTVGRAKEYISLQLINSQMLVEYIKAAMDKATYEIIDDPEPFYGEIPELKGVWATGKTLEACRDSLMSALEDWIVFRLRTGRSIPSIGAASIVVSAEPVSVVE